MNQMDPVLNRKIPINPTLLKRTVQIRNRKIPINPTLLKRRVQIRNSKIPINPTLLKIMVQIRKVADRSNLSQDLSYQTQRAKQTVNGWAG
jgi:hypothetical protein